MNETHYVELVIKTGNADQSLATVNKEIEKVKGSAGESGGKVLQFNKALQGLDSAEREASKAMRGLSGALGGVHSGAVNAVGAIGDLAGVLTGGGLTIGFTALSIAAVKLYEALETAAENEKIFSQSVASMREAVSRASPSVDAYRRMIDDLARSNREFGKSQGELIVGGIKSQIQLMESSLNKLEDATEKSRDKVSRLFAGDKSAASRAYNAALGYGEESSSVKEASVEREIIKTNEARMQRIRSDLASLIEELGRAEEEYKKSEENKKQADGGKKTKGEDSVGYKLDAGQMLADAESKRKAAEDEQRAMREAAQTKARKELAEELEKADQKDHERRLAREIAKVDIAMEAKEKILATWADFGSQMTGNLVGGIAGGFSTLFAEMAAGNKHAAEIALSSFLSSTGQQIIASGTQSVVQGTLFAVNPLTAAAAPGMIGAGLAAIGVGTAMAAGGAGISASIPKPSTGSRATGGAGERGTGSGLRSGGIGSGDNSGSVVVNINYAAGGPSPEDTAREIASLNDVGRRRGFNGRNRRSM